MHIDANKKYSPQIIPTGILTLTPLVYGTWAYTNPADDLGEFNGTRFTATIARRLLLNCRFYYRTMYAGANMYIALVLNGGIKYKDWFPATRNSVADDGSAQGCHMVVSPAVSLNPGDWIEFEVCQDSGFDCDCGQSIPNNWLTIESV